MKLARIGLPGKEQPVVLDPHSNKLALLSGVFTDFNQQWLKDGGFEELQKLFAHIEKREDGLPRIAIEDVGRFGPPIVPAKIRCIGQNYAKHAREAGMAEPEEPAVFNKDADSAAGAHDPLAMPPGVALDLFWRPNPKDPAVKGMPKGCHCLDYEVEKAFVVRRSLLGATPQEIQSDLSRFILGYVAMNDVSQRDWQLRSIGGLWDLGKSGRGWAAFAPFLVTTDEIPDPNNLRLWCKVNGQLRQDSNTGDMIHKDSYILAYLSQFSEVPPMLVVSTGTPEGVGMAKGYLKLGDEVEWGIEALGPSGKHKIVAWEDLP
jgi:2-keto-4-pentenoate hydratase/2-oxohepta-3-ene-1,7-dioic acid hydratase in catechol pathway